jgi:hypothetical protein
MKTHVNYHDSALRVNISISSVPRLRPGPAGCCKIGNGGEMGKAPADGKIASGTRRERHSLRQIISVCPPPKNHSQSFKSFKNPCGGLKIEVASARLKMQMLNRTTAVGQGRTRLSPLLAPGSWLPPPPAFKTSHPSSQNALAFRACRRRALPNPPSRRGVGGC